MAERTATGERLILPDALARALAGTYGTPLYVLSEPLIRAKMRAYRRALEASWPGAELAYASKANVTLAVLGIAASEGLLLDVASEGEFRAALRAGADPARCFLHGSNKQDGEIAFAIEHGIGQIVVDNFEEVGRLPAGAPPVLLRLAPCVDPHTHAKVRTGQADTKFGFNIADGSALRAFLAVRERGLHVAGLHCHVGSQLLDPEAQLHGAGAIAEFAAALWRDHGASMEVLNVGGGNAVRYGGASAPLPLDRYCRLIAEAVRTGLAGTELRPRLIHEPGRALVAEAGVTLYRVGVRKTVPLPGGASRTYLSVDGGLSDNPRPALYAASYELLAVGRSGPTSPFRIAGKHCEVDTLFDAELPRETGAGDLLQVLATGAYNSSMASNYNLYPRPSTVLLREHGGHTLVQRHDDWDELLARDVVPPDLTRPCHP
jgi:diaminopimelate decarboxylase